MLSSSFFSSLLATVFAAGIPKAKVVGVAEVSTGLLDPKANPELLAGTVVVAVFSSVTFFPAGIPKLNWPLTAPNENWGNFSSGAPGFDCSQHAHLERLCSFRVMHVEHSHLACCVLTSWPKPLSDELAFVVLVSGTVEVVPLNPKAKEEAALDPLDANGFELLIFAG